MNARILFVLALAFGTAAGTAGAASAPDLAATLKARFDGDRSGACLLAARIDGARVERVAFCARPRADAPDPQSAFEIGSVTKTMTAFLVADLVAAGQWSLDDPIAKHLPPGTPVPRQGERQILVRDLVTHTSGLAALPARMHVTDPADPYASLTEAELLASLGDVELTRPIGSQAAYSNFGMMVLSDAVARAEGTSIEAALRTRLFQPLGMAGAYVDRPAPGEPVAVGHSARGTPTAAWTIAPALAGVGMVRATLADMVAYVTAEMDAGTTAGPLAERLKLTQQALTAHSAMNWMRMQAGGHDLLVHEGATGGFSSFVGFEPAARRGVVILCDTALSDAGGLGDVGLALLGAGTAVAAPHRAVAMPPALRRAMPGEYQLGALTLRVREADGRLFAQATGQSEFELLADDQGELVPSSFDAMLVPMQVDGQVDRFVWRQGGGSTEGVRVGSAAAVRTAAAAASSDASLPPDCDGSYRLTPQFSLRVFRDAGGVKVQGTGQAALPAAVVGPDRGRGGRRGGDVRARREGRGGRRDAGARRRDPARQQAVARRRRVNARRRAKRPARCGRSTRRSRPRPNGVWRPLRAGSST